MPRSPRAKLRRYLSHGNPGKFVVMHHAELNTRIFLDVLLQVLGKLLIALRGNHGQRIDLEATQPLALLIDAQAQPRPMVCRRQRSVSRVEKLQIWKTFGLSQPSFSAECEKMNFSGDSKDPAAFPCRA
jgi:hypothetical protein